MKFLAYLRLMRPKQWVKNVFVLAPLIFSFKLTSISAVTQSCIAALAFCFVASVIYIVNDLMDVEADRQHPKKRKRPLASGKVGKSEAIAFTGILGLITGLILLYGAFNITFYVLLSVYFTLSLGYSLGLKQVPLLELFIVASGYVFRLLAGCAALNVLPSPWMLAATGAVALLITAGKRRAEIAENHDPAQLRRSLKQYNLTFLDSAITMLAAVTVVTYLLFTTSEYAIERFHSSYLVGTSVFVLYGVLRYLQLVKVMAGTDDPTTLVLTDLNLRYAVLGWLASCIAMIYS